MNEYPKIKTLYKRDPETRFKTLILREFEKPEFAYLATSKWAWTEKVDGTNIRVHWSAEEKAVYFAGKRRRSNIPGPLLSHLQQTFPADLFAAQGWDGDVTLFGEGYGRGIQKVGDRYLADRVSFILFDVQVGDLWLEWSNVVDVARKLGIEHVPFVGYGDLYDAVELVRHGFLSEISEDPGLYAEGLVLRPLLDLQTRRGERIITKIKTKDFDGMIGGRKGGDE